MSKLQNNYTTIEQSKRLLELGLPRDSADIWYIAAVDNQKKYPPFPSFSYWVGNMIYKHDLPCWSVGRLMEIFAICFDPDFIHFDTYADGINFLQQMMDKFETYAENMDFSKLEE